MAVIPASPPIPPEAEQWQQALGQIAGIQALQRLPQVHALEHATLWVLSNPPAVMALPQAQRAAHPLRDDHRFHGLSTPEGFYLYGPTSGPRLDWSVRLALRRLQAGEVQLTIHPRCGTQVAAQVLLTAGLATASLALLAGRPLAQLAGVAGAIAAAAELAPATGRWCQAHLTTALPRNLRLGKVYPCLDPGGRPAHWVQVHWVEV